VVTTQKVTNVRAQEYPYVLMAFVVSTSPLSLILLYVSPCTARVSWSYYNPLRQVLPDTKSTSIAENVRSGEGEKWGQKEEGGDKGHNRE